MSEKQTYPKVILKVDRRTGHPWYFQKSIVRSTGDDRIKNGSVVDLLTPKSIWVGRGIYNGHARIALRLLTTNPEEMIDAAFFRRRIRAAVALRRETLKIDSITDSYRVIHSEGDQLSGLVVDKFGSALVLEFFALGMYRFRDEIIAILQEEFPDSQVTWFAQEHVQKQESFDCRSPESLPPRWITENGVTFKVEPGTGHKTGFFLDQRDNRRRLSELVRGKAVLDLCCNSGGFSVYAAAAGGASRVTGVDIDPQVLELAKENAAHNKCENVVTFVAADMFAWVREAADRGDSYDVVVLDPAKQTKDRDGLDAALGRYYEMNALAMQIVRPGGVLLTCSCTGLIKEDDFLETIRRSAFRAKREVQIFQVTGAGGDHPHLASVPETRYLKAVWCRVLS